MKKQKVLAVSMGGMAALGAVAAIGFPAAEAAIAYDRSATVTLDVVGSCGIQPETASGANFGNDPTSAEIQGTEFTVACNTTGGWSLTEKASTENGVLLNTNGSIVGTSAASASSPSDFTSGVNEWGLKFTFGGDNISTAGNKDTYHALSSSAVEFASSTTATVATQGATFQPTYGVNLDGPSLPAGTYSTTVTYTMTVGE